MTFKLKEQKSPGFAEIDIKQMNDTINYMAMPALLLLSYNLKIELCLTVPLTMVANHWTIGKAYADIGTNMDGFAEPDA